MKQLRRCGLRHGLGAPVNRQLLLCDICSQKCHENLQYSSRKSAEIAELGDECGVREHKLLLVRGYSEIKHRFAT